ncbi:MAG: GNAT family N-acetyltransferase [Gemmatimonadaceae bacterium]
MVRLSARCVPGELLEMKLSFEDAIESDAAAIASLRSAVADRLTEEHGRGHWSSAVTETGVLFGMRTSRVIIARRKRSDRMIATMQLSTRKPWAINPAYFTSVRKPVYLTAMAVEPDLQRKGIGRSLLDEAEIVARAWPSNAIRLDAYEGEAGAGAFYAKCGFREVGQVVYRKTPLVYFELLL